MIEFDGCEIIVEKELGVVLVLGDRYHLSIDRSISERVSILIDERLIDLKGTRPAVWVVDGDYRAERVKPLSGEQMHVLSDLTTLEKGEPWGPSTLRGIWEAAGLDPADLPDGALNEAGGMDPRGRVTGQDSDTGGEQRRE